MELLISHSYENRHHIKYYLCDNMRQLSDFHYSITTLQEIRLPTSFVFALDSDEIHE